ncbi:Copper chaperone CopZ [Pedobacter xixiisoli]|uniref:Copper chaperone CopZ n=2 Tax=Pedobacter xixiisoli TaxID=1476464 RepID=A0A285ZPB1_9SPHI|nr:Copper chaperone CopZ [Pedobacter xixiisoli]
MSSCYQQNLEIMNSLKMIAVVVFTMLGTAAFAQTKTDKIKVLGNCGMCKKRIETGLKDAAITSATWDKDNKFLTVSYDSTKISNEKIQQKIAALGHDTDKAKAKNEVYDKLPGCCKYDRTGKTVKAH